MIDFFLWFLGMAWKCISRKIISLRRNECLLWRHKIKKSLPRYSDFQINLLIAFQFHLHAGKYFLVSICVLRKFFPLERISVQSPSFSITPRRASHHCINSFIHHLYQYFAFHVLFVVALVKILLEPSINWLSYGFTQSYFRYIHFDYSILCLGHMTSLISEMWQIDRSLIKRN